MRESENTPSKILIHIESIKYHFSEKMDKSLNGNTYPSIGGRPFQYSFGISEPDREDVHTGVVTGPVSYRFLQHGLYTAHLHLDV